MKSDKKWKILNKLKIQDSRLNTQELLDILLTNRGLITKKDRELFLHPDSATVTAHSVGIAKNNEEKTVSRIKMAIRKKEQIIVFGDYDVDGIAGTAILWETLNQIGARVMPYIPSRTDEGYGLSVKGIENVLQQYPETALIITVDNGIVANKAVDFAKEKKIDVIITDHHLPGDVLPHAQAIFHTTQLCGTGVAWVLSRILSNFENDHLALVALATVADLVPLQNANRIVLAEGLDVLRTTKRPGIVALCEDAKIDQEKIDVYEIGHILGPRINAMGRISNAMDSLRLLCTKDRLKAKVFAEKLGLTNTERQDLTKRLSEHAVIAAKEKRENLLFLYHQTYDEGVIGLVAGKLVERYYRPSIVIAVGEKVSKASARSITGFNIIAFIRKAEHLLINAGGHPMAAGFTVATEKVTALEEFLLDAVKNELSEELLTKVITIDCELPLQFISQKIYDAMQVLQPFGMGNPEPLFAANATIISARQVGQDKNHLSLFVGDEKKSVKFSAIGFGMGEKMNDLKVGDTVQIVYSIDENIWKDKKNLQLKIKDIKTT